MKVFQVISFKEGCDAHASETTVNTNMFTLVQLGLIKDHRKGKDKIDRFITRRDLECQAAVLYLQQISEAHHYDRYKSRFLYQNSVKCYYGYIIRPDKVEAFLNKIGKKSPRSLASVDELPLSFIFVLIAFLLPADNLYHPTKETRYN